MNSVIEMGVLKLELQIATAGPLSKKEAETIQRELLDFFKKKKLNVSGKIKHLRVTTFEFEHNNVYMDTSSK